MRVLIVEDESLVAKSLSSKLDQLGHDILGVADNVTEALEMIRDEIPDAILLDIELKGSQSGIDLAKILSKENTPFVFISEKKDDASFERIKSIGLGCFLEKPVSLTNLKYNLTLAVEKVKNIIQTDTNNSFFVKGTNGRDLIPVLEEDIIYLKAEGNGCLLFRVDKLKKENFGKTMLSSPMGTIFSNKFRSNQFIRVHKSYVVNLVHVKGVSDNLLSLSNNISIPIGEKYRADFLSKIELL